MAPGGELVDDRNGDGYPEGVLSTVQRSFDFLQGTSMATPHMAGLGVLMKSLRPGLTQPEAEQLIKDTMRTDSSLTCTECGHAGLVSAAAVVAQLGTNAQAPFTRRSPAPGPHSTSTPAAPCTSRAKAWALHWALTASRWRSWVPSRRLSTPVRLTDAAAIPTSSAISVPTSTSTRVNPA